MDFNDILDKFINKDLVDIIISNPKNKEKADGEVLTKIKIRPVLIQNKLYFQATSYVGKQVLHENYDEDTIRIKLRDWMIHDYKQGQFLADGQSASVLSGKKGNLTVKYKKESMTKRIQAPLSHNRSKQYILEEGTPVPFLIDLGVMTREGKVVHARYDKFRQINRFLEFIEDILPQLDKNTRQTIIDFGCGKSYLTFAMYYYLRVLKGYDIRIIGLDLKKDVIKHCEELAKKYGYTELEFLTGDIASYDGTDKVNMVVTLHACDTATDYALYKAVKWDADVILSVPCCQHEANRQIQNKELDEIFKYGIIKERMAALITDGVRANLLERCGYKTQILEFIDMEHTPKNLLIRAVKDRSRKNMYQKCGEFDTEASCSLDLTLHRLLREDGILND
ncbi:MAG: SAM-dependent methyltransferase [Thermoflexaceae bacterium]|nr:SAM-dependent methyltransferase [Thermoflexaceae bacterium]